MEKKYRGRGTVGKVGTNKHGDPYALINAVGGHTVYLDLGLITKWSGFKPGMVIDPNPGDSIEFVCERQGTITQPGWLGLVSKVPGFRIVEVTNYEPLPHTKHRGFIKREDYRWEESEELRAGRRVVIRKHQCREIQYCLYETGVDEPVCLVHSAMIRRHLDYRFDLRSLMDGERVDVVFEKHGGSSWRTRSI